MKDFDGNLTPFFVHDPHPLSVTRKHFKISQKNWKKCFLGTGLLEKVFISNYVISYNLNILFYNSLECGIVDLNLSSCKIIYPELY